MRHLKVLILLSCLAPISASAQYTASVYQWASATGSCTILEAEETGVFASVSAVFGPTGPGFGVGDGYAAGSGSELTSMLRVDVTSSPFHPGSDTIAGGCGYADLVIEDVVISGPAGPVDVSTSVFLRRLLDIRKETPERGGYSSRGQLIASIGSIVLNLDLGDPDSGSGLIQTASRTITVGSPFDVSFSLRTTLLASSVEYNIDPASAVWEVFTQVDVRVPTNQPFFDLPPGYTANSADGLIVDNRMQSFPNAVSAPRGGGGFHVEAPYPNPFSGSTSVAFSLGRDEAVEATVFDLRGRKVRRLTNGVLATGSHRLAWDGRNEAGDDVAPGVYFVRVRAGETIESRRIVRLR